MKTLLAVVLLAMPVLAADQAPAVAAVTAACGLDSVTFKADSNAKVRHAAVEPDAGKALVYVVGQFDRPVNYTLVTPTLRIGMDGAWMGANYGTSYFSFSVEPGEHHLCSDWQSFPFPPQVPASLASLTAEAGHTYYFRARIIHHSRYGPWTLDLQRTDNDEGQMLVATAPLSDYRQKK